MFVRKLMPVLAITAVIAAAPSAAVTNVFNFAGPAGTTNVASVERTNNGVTGVATALNFTLAPGLLTNFSQFTSGTRLIQQTSPGIGALGGASSPQMDTNQSANREAILLTTTKSLGLTALKLSFIDNDDTLAIFGVNADNTLTNLGFGGEIRVVGGTALAGAATGTFAAGTNSGTSTLTFNERTARFDRFIFTTRVGGDFSYLGTLGQDYRIDSISGIVPEPGTWAMLVLGFGLVGATARRRRPATVLA
jgi:hypothetical protein